MISSRDPGVLGVYGFRNRKDYSYDHLVTADSDFIRVKRLWDYLSDAGKQSVLVGVPQTYPVHPINGALVSDFLDAGQRRELHLPRHPQGGDACKLYPNYKFDVSNFRTDDKERLLQDLLDMTAMQTGLVKHLMKTKPVGLLHVRQHRRGSAASRLLALPRSGAPALHAGQSRSSTPSATTTR